MSLLVPLKAGPLRLDVPQSKGDGVDQIQRNGEWWHRQPDGSWLRFDVASGQWLAAGSPPPPPPPPPPGAGGPYVPLERTARRGISLDGLRGSLAGLDRRIALVGGAALLAVLLVAGGFAAFGGNDGGVDLAAAAVPLPEPEPMSKKQQFIHDADQICADFLAKAEALQKPTDLAGLIDYLKTAWSINEEATHRAKDLRVPKDARSGWDRFVGHPQDGRRIERMIGAARAGDAAELQRLATLMQKKGARDTAWAERYGMKICSRRSLPQA